MANTTGKGTWQKGQSGNPAGRPPTERALATVLAATLDKTLPDADGKRHNGKIVLARLVSELVTTGECTLPNGTRLVASVRDWLDAVKFVYSHIDGPARAALELTGKDGGPITTQSAVRIYLPDNGRHHDSPPGGATGDVPQHPG